MKMQMHSRGNLYSERVDQNQNLSAVRHPHLFQEGIDGCGPRALHDWFNAPGFQISEKIKMPGASLAEFFKEDELRTHISSLKQSNSLVQEVESLVVRVVSSVEKQVKVKENFGDIIYSMIHDIFLDFIQKERYYFDTLRRAKFSSIMILDNRLRKRLATVGKVSGLTLLLQLAQHPSECIKRTEPGQCSIPHCEKMRKMFNNWRGVYSGCEEAAEF